MAYLYDLPNATSGMDAIMVQTATAVPSFIPLMLLFIFFMVWLGGMGRQKLRTGTSDASMWMLIASMSIFMLALILSIPSGLMRLDWLIEVVCINIISVTWFIFSRKPSEV